MPPPLNKEHREHANKISVPTRPAKYLLRVLENFQAKIGTKRSPAFWDFGDKR